MMVGLVGPWREAGPVWLRRTRTNPWTNEPQEEASPELLPFQSEAVAELHELVS